MLHRVVVGLFHSLLLLLLLPALCTSPESFDLRIPDIEQAFRSKQKLVHPDKFGNRSDVRTHAMWMTRVVVVSLCDSGVWGGGGGVPPLSHKPARVLLLL